MSADEKLLLVGDNPFLGVSHLSQERAKARGSDVTTADHAAELVSISFNNGADGFLFSIGELSLSVLNTLRKREDAASKSLLAIAPWSFEYVRAAVRLGGLPGLAGEVSRRVVRSRNIYAVLQGARGALSNDIGALFKAYMSYEVSRVRSAAGRDARLESLLLHEIVTDMALGFDMEWMFRAHVDANRRAGTKPGYNTRNLPLLVAKLREWGISLDGSVIAAPFNAEGFQMCPSMQECEAVLAELGSSEVIAFSILAAGHLNYSDAIEYVAELPNLRGAVVGVSKPEHARSTFGDLRRSFERAAAS